MKDRIPTTINASSMADIAFLLLIFFLVSSTIEVEKAIPVKLPESHVPGKTGKSVEVILRPGNELMIQGDIIPYSQLNSTLADLQKGGELQDVTFHLQADDDVLYEQYISFYDGVRSFYKQLWNEKALEEHNTTFQQLSSQSQKKIKEGQPLKITELF